MSFLEYSRYNRGDGEAVTGSEVNLVIDRINLIKLFSCLCCLMGITMAIPIKDGENLTNVSLYFY